MPLLETPYGHFSEDGGYVVTDPRTPSPWVNILAPGPGYGAILSAAGGGFSWLDHPTLNRTTRWSQDHVRDEAGRWLYLLEEGRPPTSLAWQPTRRDPSAYRVRHDFGSTTYEWREGDLESSWRIFIPPGRNVEVWDVRLRNNGRKRRGVRLVSYLEWCLGPGPDVMREFEKCFFELDWRDGVLLASKRLWKIPGGKGHYGRGWPYVAFHAAWPEATRFAVEKERFLGRYGRFDSPAFGLDEALPENTGATDAIASLDVSLTVDPGKEARAVFLVGVAPKRASALAEVRKLRTFAAVDAARDRVARFWRKQLEGLRVETPDPAVDVLANGWLPYQVLAAREWGKTSYYWHGGAVGAREIQDALALMVSRPDLARERLRDNLAHIAKDGTVPHHWDPLTGEVGKKAWSDDMLWTAFVLIEYAKETGDLSLFTERHPWLDGGAASGLEHVHAALRRVLSRKGRSGLPLILEGDWNDGLSAVGLEGRGESVWLGQFLHGLLLALGPISARLGEPERAKAYAREAATLRRVLNRVGWDGAWYRRARTDGGTWLGSRANREGRIYLNPQVWAITMGVVSSERLPKVLAALDRHLYGAEGPVLFAPPYRKVDSDIGYLTRYAPGVRENGGVYTHAVNWAIWAECVAGRADRAWNAFRAIAPPIRGMAPDRYRAEPYATAGNIEGPPSPHAGRGGWTWFTSSGAWLFKVLTERLLGIRPELDGLRIDPVLPAEWAGFRAVRRFRGATYRIEVRRAERDEVPGAIVDGAPVPDLLVPAHADGRTHAVVVIV